MQSKLKLSEYTAKFPFILFYQGNYEEAPSHSIISIVEKNLSILIKKNTVKGLIYLIIEALQNIERYSAHVLSSEDFSFVYSDGKFFHIFTQNMIRNDKMGGLKERLDAIVTQGKEELDATYKAVLTSDVRTEKGAGLGLIDMARKSRNALFYSFDKKTEEYSTYSLGFAIPLDKSDTESVANIEETKSILSVLKDNFKSNRSTLYYGGDFSNEFLRSLLDLLKKVKKNETNSTNTKTHHILIELTQNIKKHAYKQNDVISGQLFLEWQEKGLRVTTYNQIEDHKLEKLSAKINKLNAANEQELKEISKAQLTDFTQASGVGLVDVALLAYPEKISFQSIKKGNLVNEIILTINVNHE